jgi:hypothetical protein
LSSLLGHARVNLAMDVYDQADERDLRESLQMLHSGTQGEEAA